MNPPCRPTQGRVHTHTRGSSCISPTSAPRNALPNTLCKINHTLNAVNRLWNESGERLVMFLYTRINKYRAQALPLHLRVWWLCTRLPSTCRQTLTNTRAPARWKQTSMGRVLAGLKGQKHIISLSAWVCPLCTEQPANLIKCFKYAVDCSTRS